MDHYDLVCARRILDSFQLTLGGSEILTVPL
jgi:hypothetical protein